MSLALALFGCVDDFPSGAASAVEAGPGADLGPSGDADPGSGAAGGGPGGAGGGPGGAGGGGAGGGIGGAGGAGGEAPDAGTENPDPDQGALFGDAALPDGAVPDAELGPESPDRGVPGDLGGDGGSPGPDCDDDGPPAIETCNGVDDDCDGTIDEGATPVGACVVGLGECRREGQHTCIDGVLGCTAEAGPPVAEIPNNQRDDNCNGLVDEIPCPANTLRSDDGRSCMWRGDASLAWDYANSACDHISIGGTPGRMATLETESQWRLARQLVAGRQSAMWLGARRNRNSPTGWRWNLGTDLSTDPSEGRWANGEPNNAGLGESCAELRPDGRLNDASCLSWRVPLCELEYFP